MAVTGAVATGMGGRGMARSDEVRPIIKRKKIIQAGGHHGGAWKVAYADFVTAMMAFFLLMWLLNATTEDQRKGIADYFSPSLPISRVSAGGDGLFQGKTIEADNERTENGVGAKHNMRGDAEEPTDATAQAEQVIDEEGDAVARAADERAFSVIESLLSGDSGESTVEDELLQHIETRVTEDGLIIEIIDRNGPPLFRTGTDAPSVKMLALLDLVAEVANLITNPIAVEGHTDAIPFAGEEYDNWDLSTDRAQAARRRMEDQGVERARFRRVAGRGDSAPAVEDPFAAQNRRIILTFLRRGIEPRE